MRYYTLDKEKNVVPTDLRGLVDLFKRRPADRIVEKTDVDQVTVSTVFLGIDHGFGSSDKPIVFETMVFGGELNDEMTRCSTWTEAEKMHSDMVARVEQTFRE